MKIIDLYPGGWASQCYLLEEAGHAFVVDPSADAKSILERLDADGCSLDGILLTHGHFDHILAIDDLRHAVPMLPLYLHDGDADLPGDAVKNAYFLLCGINRTWEASDRSIKDGDILTLGESEIRVIHTPGHTRGSVSYLIESANALLTGDTLFDGNIGRYDLYGGDLHTLLASLDRLAQFNEALEIFPGHGGSTTLGRALAHVRGEL